MSDSGRTPARGEITLGAYTQAVREANDLRQALMDLAAEMPLSEQQMRQISAKLTRRDIALRPGIAPFEPPVNCTIEARRHAFLQWLIGRPPAQPGAVLAKVPT